MNHMLFVSLLGLVAVALCWSLAVALYPPFLAAALGTGLTRPFGRTTVRMAIAVMAVSTAMNM